jgi:anaerobic ribonucleoside-triphosphate reductase/predicted transcriptional regulator
MRGIRVLKAVSSAVRLNILNALFDHGPLSYTELMSFLKMNPSRDAGRFAYHLKFLLKADLIEADVESKKYRLTDLGKMVIDVAEEIEKRSLRVQRILVRTSRFTLEEFDTTRIADSLIKEAGMPPELAQKIAKEAEKRLLKARTRYLTAPLIREVVNGILIERGLEEYRHKLTRLGIPVHDVSACLLRGKTSVDASSTFEEFGRNVLEEYTLLNILPRDIADAYLSGEIHIHSLGSWILKPSEIIHDLRFFIKNGLSPTSANISQPFIKPPRSLDSALNLVFNVLLQTSRETDGTQVLEYFNVFLAPFLKGLDTATVKEALRFFILNVSRHVNVSINLELTVPEFLADKPVVAGLTSGCYGDFLDESQLLASLILEVFAEESLEKPLLNPKFIVKIRRETFTNGKASAILLRAHCLASERGTPYFANLLDENGQYSTFSPSGGFLKADFKGDWEIDTLRTGILGIVTVNLPRIAYECDKDEAKFFTLLRERLEMAARALEIKYKALKQRGRSFLPFLAHSANSDQYFRVENTARLINLVGLKEASETLGGKSIYEDENSLNFASKIVKQVLEFIPRGRRERRLLPSASPSADASERLAKQDIERFGVAKVRFLGTREKPYYSAFGRISLQNLEIPAKILVVERELYKPLVGGNLTVLELGDTEYTPETLFSLTKRLIENYKLELFTYNRNLTYCSQCRKSWFGTLQKCPECGSVGTLTAFTRF